MAGSTETFDSVENQLKLEKLRLEIVELRRTHSWNRSLGLFLPVLSALVPILALLFAVQQFVQQQKGATDALRRQTEADNIASERAFMVPVLARQMDTYFEVSGAAATLASSESEQEKAKARDVFWKLYYGPLVMLESPEVSGAMKAFGNCLRQPLCRQLKNLSLELSSSLQADFFASSRLSPEKYAKRSIDYAKHRGR